MSSMFRSIVSSWEYEEFLSLHHHMLVGSLDSLLTAFNCDDKKRLV